MKPSNNHPRFRRRLLTWSAALLALLFAGTGVALADDDSDRQYEYSSAQSHGNDGYAAANHRGHHGKQRYDRHRGHDHGGGSCRVDRHRSQHRYDQGRSYRHHDRHRGYYQSPRHRYYKNDYRNDRYRHRRHFEVPRAIAHHLLHSYRPYHHGRVYYSQHRHHHDIYRFPVYSEYGVEYYPHAYCEGSFFGRGVFRDGRAVFDVRIGF
ncbi:MAG: hypothetical protein GY719_35410 [bacterium]|nr:hypothetical protein [bacterium]